MQSSHGISSGGVLIMRLGRAGMWVFLKGYHTKYVSTAFPETTFMEELVKHATNTLKNAWMPYSLTSLSSLNKLMTFDLVVRSRLQV